MYSHLRRGAYGWRCLFRKMYGFGIVVVDCCCIAMYLAQFTWRFQQVSTCCSVECDLLLMWLYASSEKSDEKNFEKSCEYVW